MEKILNTLPQKLIEICFYALFFLVPLVLTPINYELFEYNKMMATYGLTTVVVGAWIIKMIINKRVSIRRTPLDLPFLLFFVSQVVSTIFSIDRHVSLFGYYSRFNGGLFSTVSYLLLYYAFVSNFPKEKILKLLKVTLFSGLLVSLYGILEHLGIDKDLWVQDVQNRVFSTLGQPNWLAAYLAILIPITVGFLLNSKLETRNSNKSEKSKTKNPKRLENFGFENLDFFNISSLGFIVLVSIFYTTLIFTKSRSGFLGAWISLMILWVSISILAFQNYARAEFWKSILKIVSTNIAVICIITFFFGAPFEQINRFTLPELINKQPAVDTQQPTKPTGGSLIDVGITESGTIRKIVWKGAIDIFRHYPLFGSGVETFAFSYYKFRPVEHNMTSEWDFLYNKAHNEYLNYAATTGAFGLGSYLLIIGTFILWFLAKNTKIETLNSNKYQNPKTKNSKQFEKFENLSFIRVSSLDFNVLSLGLFAGWLSILITNFFGFSVVIIQLLFFLIPAMAFVLVFSDNSATKNLDSAKINNYQKIIILIILLATCYILLTLCRLWYADVFFADGYHKARGEEIAAGYQSLKKALETNDGEPLYYDELSFPAAQLAVAFADEKQATLSSVLTQEALIASNFAVGTEPQNVNFWKTRTRVFYALSRLDEKYFSDALNSLEQAKILAPTDPKIRYNLGLLYDRIDKKEEAVSELVTTTKLKPDYRDAFFALAYLYEKDGKRTQAKEALQYIISKIATDDAEAKEKLKELK